ncbi:uncharacterized protein LOC122013594 [Zingiber officinale]|uniref:uncharacterized protein LOC122013594 n=1 Tax=Zingiber officinale TaxID=94328 RepID=UPI001C4BF9B1|nr:uncharacterized protein LOC122013594 [Zingiber officinale]
MIAGGPTGDDSNRARKLYAQGLKIHTVGYSKEKAEEPQISFGPSYLEGVEIPHDDALIIRTVIANHTIHRTFVVTGSSVNIIFKKAFDQLQIDRNELLPMATSLYGFTGNEQLPRAFEISSTRLRLYAEIFEKLKANFQEVVIHKIPRSENQVVDELAKLASSLSTIVVGQPIEQVSLVAHIDCMERITFPNDWRMALIEFLHSGTAPADPEDARLIKKRVGRFTLIDDQLYKKAFSRPLLKCVGPEDVDYILNEVHQGSCGGGCCSNGCNLPVLPEVPQHTAPTEEMKASTVSCSFDQWGIDIVGLFPMATGHQKFLLVAVDYFSKWVEVEPLARITERMVTKFIWQNIICQFGIPRRLVSDNGRQFVGRELKEWCEGYDIQQSFTSVAYPQGNGQAEVANREILRVLHARLDHMGGSKVDELPSVLWALLTTLKEATSITLFQLIYDGEAVAPVEVGVEADRVQHYDKRNAERRLMELDLVDEAREKVVIWITTYR